MPAALASPYRIKRNRRHLRRRTSGRTVYAYVGGNPISRIDPFGLAAATGAMADCLTQIFGQSVASVNVRMKAVVKNNIVTTRTNEIRLPPILPIEQFFTRHHLVLHEYHHVINQWNTGEMTIRSYLAEVARSGSWTSEGGNRYEAAADAFADSNLASFQECLKKASECDK